MSAYRKKSGGSRARPNSGRYISVITACFNAAPTLERTLLSLSGQDENFEHIVIDGGSDDGTVEILQRYDKAINHWISAPDKGIYHAMNKGARLAGGQWIAFLNADDGYLPKTIAHVLETIQHNRAAVIYGDLLKRRPLQGKVFERLEKPHLADMKAGMSIFHPATFMRRGLFEELGGYDTRYSLAADYDLLLRAYLHKTDFVYLNKPLAVFYTGGASNTSCGTYSEAAAIQTRHHTGFDAQTRRQYRLCLRKRLLRRIVFSLSRLPGGQQLLRAVIGKRWQ